MIIKVLDVVSPTNVAVSAARTCYYPHGLVEPEKSEGWKAKERLLDSIFKAGHHTTLQHTHITLMIEGMSRHLIWRLLHAHPYYNSEQVSQRYAKMKSDAFVYPSGGDREAWEGYYGDIFDRYEKLITMLIPVMEGVLPKFKKKEATKKAQEMARYLLPMGMSAYLYHTINIITALRYIAGVKALPEAKDEGEMFASLLETILLDIDPSLQPLIEEAKKAKVVFPRGKIIQEVKAREMIDDHRTKVYGIVEPEAFEINDNYGDVLRLSQLYPDGGVMGGFSAYIRLSLAADAQNQRHRRSVAVRPPLDEIYTPSYYTPPIIAQHPEIADFYHESCQEAYRFFEQQVETLGFGEAVYALPNAHEIEILERNDFAAFHHKAQMRLCYNAQQEIYDIVYEQVQQLRDHHVANAQTFLPPCSVRQELGIHPICPEGDRFCGVKVWKLPFDAFKREI